MNAELILAPLLRLLGPERSEVARAAVDKGLISVEPVLNLWLEETRVSEAEVEVAAHETVAERELAEHVDAALAHAVQREEERWAEIGRAVSGDAGAADAVVRAFGIEGPVASSEGFGELMRDPEGILELPGPPRPRTGGFSPELRRVARRVTDPPISASAARDFAADDAAAHRLANGQACGACLRAEARDAVLLGDGTAVTVRDDHYVIQRLSLRPSWKEVSLFRLASGSPPTLLPPARAALASCLAHRADANQPAPPNFAPKVLLGAALVGETTPPMVLARIGQLLRDLAERPDAMAPALLEIASLIFRVHVRLVPATLPSGRQVARRPIDVGRLRWCSLSDSPSFWIPVAATDRDMIGGIDRPWTRDIPAAAARWQASPSSMRLDPDWYARIVVIPGDSNMWCVDPDGAWWSLDADFDTVLQSRRSHLAPWLAAIEGFGMLMDKQIQQAKHRRDT